MITSLAKSPVWAVRGEQLRKPPTTLSCGNPFFFVVFLVLDLYVPYLRPPQTLAEKDRAERPGGHTKSDQAKASF